MKCEEEVVFVDLAPRSGCRTVEIGLDSVRAADSIRVEYDFERDGWVILQASVFEGEAGFDQDWQEVAFVGAWGREEAA